MILTKVKNEIGATAIEYGLLASLIGVLAVSGMSAVGVNLSNTYCTISKHLGGSGECSGGSSKETGGSGSSTGSGNSNTGNGGNGSETSIATEDDMDNLKKSLVDDFDDSYLDRSLGGNSNSDIWSFINPKNALSLMNDYNEKNPNDQITHVFGLYDKSTNQPITSWQKASEGIENQINGKNAIETGNYHSSSIEVTTQSGHVYNINSEDNTMTKQLMKGS
ncbi:Flp family type IVb pilin [Gluconacetobacter sp.]|uniref:Flp family type IVb pilin n=1 Tax=Gluconacetobacter sp. TaxID=1935994 RepID=UPI0039E9E51C